ncbi:biotin-dependent carboxyltransferase family protein [Ekhidna sp.]|uniref:5-oxoprolinase subunit C family protein n=1 Tax=Ekhidna sp. TaxID=2608089 RepID=UPI003B507FDF
MGKLKVISTGPLTTIQDFGRFGFRRYGIPQSGAMDKEMMIAANSLVGNPESFPVIELAIAGLKLEVLEPTTIAVIGSELQVNGVVINSIVDVTKGDQISISSPEFVYAYLGIKGRLTAKKDFGSASTYERAGFGGINGRSIRKEDILVTDSHSSDKVNVQIPKRSFNEVVNVRIMKGPEWSLLKELPESKIFEVDVSSDRMGIRLKGSKLDCDYKEITSSAVIPGTIQLPSDGHPIILMNDCQTTGGYPRIGKVLEYDMGKLSQVRAGREIKLRVVDYH